MSNVAIITARGGSKRIPRKNIKLFLGKPMLQYSIEAALQTGIFDEVMVSTEDEEIAQIARKAGAVVPFYRTEKTANDYATTADVVQEVLETYEQQGKHFDYACCIYPTAPFITSDRLTEGMELLEKNCADTAMPVVQFSFPPQRCVVKSGAYITPKWPECMPMRSQDLEPYYHDAGQFYWLAVRAFMEQKKIVMEKTVPIILSEMEVQDIDTEEDWAMAELKMKMLRHL
ncbi:MAG: pseudaminic acid cytidylyltransferase [Lachnospiraceae bacterium]|nr:pseudaminic acid cytidylyltransferase [Lachnospiraceae bacterium]